MAIITTLDRASSYFPNTKVFQIIFDYFSKCISSNSQEYKRINNLPLGAFERYYLTDDIFAIEQVFQTKHRDDCFFESHKKYIDMQLVLSGSEQMEYTDITKLDVNEEYNEELDVIKYHMTDNSAKLLLQSEDLAIFFIEDGHVGMPKFVHKEIVKKTVIKLPIEYIKGKK